LANLTKTIATQAVRFFGPAPATQWGAGTYFTMRWGSSKWGEGTQTILLAIQHVLAAQVVTPSDAIFPAFEKRLSISLNFGFATTGESLKNGPNYTYVFPYPTTNHESQAANTFTRLTSPIVTWTKATAASGSWR
jgi:hypothetical protein